MGVFIGGEEDLNSKLGAVWSTWMADRPYTWPTGQPSWLSPTLGVTDLLDRPALTRA
jgi:hypothetical protein